MVIPLYLSVIYLIGTFAFFYEFGMGVVLDFGSLEGVLKILQQPETAIITWIHILAFDQAIGAYIYRHNMEHRRVPLPIMSVILFFTLYLGPVGFVLYHLIFRIRTKKAIISV